MTQGRSPGGLSAELVDDPDRIAGLVPAWRRLAELRGNAFLTPEWFTCAVRMGGPRWRPAVVVVSDPADQSIVGVLPFSESGRWPRREAVLAGPVGTDLVHPAARREQEAAVAAVGISALLAARRGYVLRLGNVDAAAGWWRPVGAKRSPRLVPVTSPGGPLPYIDLAGLDWDGYLRTRSRGLRNEIGRKMRRLQRDHEVAIRWTATRAELAADIDTLFELHRSRWRDRPGASAFALESLREFHHCFAAAAFDRGWLRLLTIEIGGRGAASWYGWSLGSRWSYYQAGFDPSFGSYSIGTLVLAETVRRAIEEGAAEYDLLLGGESFKSRFANGERAASQVALVGRSSPARLGLTLRSVARGAARRLPPSARARIERLRALTSGGGDRL
jgi:CelD/BcsL family acetyltransferase involved in cellulose biosynthesis